jgi:sec-independent protein translocase protein TatC
MFAYFLVMPVDFKFLIATTPGGVGYTPDIGNFVDFATLFFLGFGAAFEIPVATVLLLWTGIVRMDTLQQNRGYVLIGIAAITAIITPPDAVSMLMMMVPMYVLYEIGIVAARIMLKDKLAAQAQQAETNS